VVADTYRLTGSSLVTPAETPASGFPSIATPFDETVTLKRKHVDDIDLVIDSPVSVAFGGVVNANVVEIVANSKVRVRVTSADGSSQSIPVDGQLKLITRSAPITAMDLTRTTGQDTNVKVFLGEKV
jgi:citrate lyase gamma subunit